MARPGKAPTSGPPEVLCPRGTQGFGNLPKDRPGLGETTYTTTVSSPCTNGVLSPQCPDRAGVPSNERSFTSAFRTLPNILCGQRKQAWRFTKSLIWSLIHFRISRITLSAHLIQHYIQLRITITHIYIISSIRRTNHTQAPIHNTK